jgi:hypothetical protein
MNWNKARKVIKNLWSYGTLNLEPQVDPDIVGPILSDELGKLSSYSGKDDLSVWKTHVDSLNIIYISESNQNVNFRSTIYAKPPRDNFGRVDLISYMDIEMLNPDENRELIDAISRFVNLADIQRVVPGGIGVNIEDYNHLRNMGGVIGPNQLKYRNY